MIKGLENYISGFQRFKKSRFQNDDNVKKVFGSQSPKVLIIACSDSRVDPAILFDSSPGDFFVIRNVANLVPPYLRDNSFHGVSAALEYAVCHLKVEHIIVMGHSSCGGVAALMSEDNSGFEFIDNWVNIAYSARLRINIMEYADDNAYRCACEQESLLVSLGNLLTFPWLKKRVKASELQIHGWYFNMQIGSLDRWSPKDKAFVTLV